MATTRLLVSIFSLLLLLITFAVNIARASAFSTAEINPNSETDNMQASFPPHWGPPPKRQTRDLVLLPGDYGRGSGTLRKWIYEKMAEDDSDGSSTARSSDIATNDGNNSLWPDKNLVGTTGDDAKEAVLAGNSELLSKNVQIVPHDAMVTMDFREDRVRIFVSDDGTVVRQPKIG